MPNNLGLKYALHQTCDMQKQTIVPRNVARYKNNEISDFS